MKHVAGGKDRIRLCVTMALLWSHLFTALRKPQLMAEWQQTLLCLQANQFTFAEFKEHLPLVSSFSRSLGGFLLHYVGILLGCQTSLGIRSRSCVLHVTGVVVDYNQFTDVYGGGGPVRKRHSCAPGAGHHGPA